MSLPNVYADFQNADSQGRVRLNCQGTIQDLARQKLQLHDGLLLRLYSDDADAGGVERELAVDGRVTFSRDENCWVAEIDWSALQSEESRSVSKVPAIYSGNVLPAVLPSTTSPAK